MQKLQLVDILRFETYTREVNILMNKPTQVMRETFTLEWIYGPKREQRFWLHWMGKYTVSRTIQTMETMGLAIVLKHQLEESVFYTLYGHLSLDSIKDVKIEQSVKQGDEIAQLGDSSINGDYAPHLHFQIIKDMQNNFGDYPGVCSLNQLSFFKENCPNPMELLGIL